MKVHSFVAASILVSLSLVGCSKKGPECEQTVSTLNPTVDALNKAMALPEEKPEQAITQAQAVTKAADDGVTAFSKLNVTTAELQKFVTDYKALLGEVSTSGKGQEAAAKEDIATGKKLEALSKQLTATTAKLDKTCNEDGMKPDESAECGKVAEILKGAPENIDDPAKFTKVVADFKKLDVKRQHTKDGVNELVATYESVAKVATESKASDAKLKAAEEAEGAAIKKQNATVDTLNKFCAN